MTDTIPITSFSGEFAFLSNFACCRVEVDGIIFPTTEHAFQASKTTDIAARKQIALLMTPGKAKRFGRTLTLRKDWDLVRVEVMRSILQKKFSQEPFKSLLIATGDRELIEGNTWGDKFWGVCNGEGFNTLGNLLMEIRREVR